MINKKNIIRLCRVHCFWQCSDFCISHCLLCWDWVSFSFDLCWNTWRVSLEWRGIWFSHWIWKALKIVLSQTRTTFWRVCSNMSVVLNQFSVFGFGFDSKFELFNFWSFILDHWFICIFCYPLFGWRGNAGKEMDGLI